MKILIFANGENNLLREELEEIFPIDKIICADGGTKFALNMNLTPDIIVGDMDSISHEIIDKIKREKIEWKIYPKEKDETDLELAVKEALKYKPKIIYFVGLLGGRIDHTLSNLFFLESIKEKGIEVIILDRKIRITLMIGEEEKIFWGNEGEIISLIPLSERVEGIILKGLKYPLNNETLYRNLTRGISNEFISKEAKIKISFGTLIVIHFLS
ncbi:MAG: thiamine diphosphokinase [Dictyoglomus sp.]|nr:thiamine diphosphokinase [Dictyoglomus sp.]MDW8188521.1 thiamine diphosphokinase [Dictyoglomus sp.]